MVDSSSLEGIKAPIVVTENEKGELVDQERIERYKTLETETLQEAEGFLQGFGEKSILSDVLSGNEPSSDFRQRLENNLDNVADFISNLDTLSLLKNELGDIVWDEDHELELQELNQRFRDIELKIIEKIFSLEDNGLLQSTSLEETARAILKSADEEVNNEIVQELVETLRKEETDEDLQENDGDDQVRRIVKRLKSYGNYAGMGIAVFYDHKMGDLGSFISFVLNPTMGSGAGYEYSYMGNENERLLPRHVFREKFRNYKLIGRTLFEFVTKYKHQLRVDSWASNNIDQDILENGSAQEIKDILVAFFNETMSENSDNKDKNLEIFKENFASVLYNLSEDQSLMLDEESLEFFKELLADDGEKLDEFWKIKKSESN